MIEPSQVSSFCFINLGTTFSTFLLGLERWIKIKFVHGHRRIFSFRATAVIFTAMWSFTLLFCVASYYLVASETTNPSTKFCRVASLATTPLLLVKPSLVLLLILLMIMMYANILVVYWKFKQRMEKAQQICDRCVPASCNMGRTAVDTR